MLRSTVPRVRRATMIHSTQRVLLTGNVYALMRPPGTAISHTKDASKPAAPARDNPCWRCGLGEDEQASPRLILLDLSVWECVHLTTLGMEGSRDRRKT